MITDQRAIEIVHDLSTTSAMDLRKKLRAIGVKITPGEAEYVWSNESRNRERERKERAAHSANKAALDNFFFGGNR